MTRFVLALALLGCPYAAAADELKLTIAVGPDIAVTRTLSSENVARFYEAIGSACQKQAAIKKTGPVPGQTLVFRPCTKEETVSHWIDVLLEITSHRVVQIEKDHAARTVSHGPLQPK